MLKIFEREVGRIFTMGKSLVGKKQRFAYPKQEAEAIRIQAREHDEQVLLKNDLDSQTSAESVKFFVDYKHSKGNYF